MQTVRFKVLSRKKFEEYVFSLHEDSSIVISISSYGEAYPFIVCNEANKIRSYITLQFNDTDSSNPAYGPMSFEQAQLIADFVKYNYTPDKTIIVHCGAGQSRSAGVMAAILKQLVGDDSGVFDNRRFTPNMLCYRLTLEALYNIMG